MCSIYKLLYVPKQKNLCIPSAPVIPSEMFVQHAKLTPSKTMNAEGNGAYGYDMVEPKNMTIKRQRFRNNFIIEPMGCPFGGRVT